MRSIVPLVLLVCSVPGAASPQNASEVDFDDSATNLTGSSVQAAIEAIDEALLGPIARFRDIGFGTPVTNGDASGLHWPLITPSTTVFFEGVISTDENGTLAQPNNVFCTSYNFGDCGSERIDSGEHGIKSMLEATRVESIGSDEYVQNRISFTASDGTTWDPWIFRVNVDENRSSFAFNSTPSLRTFTLYETGQVQIGPETAEPPSHQLEVNGTTRITQSLTVDGDLLVAGSISQAISGNRTMWGDSSDPATDTAAEVCQGFGLVCHGAHEPNGNQLGCDQPASTPYLFALCR